MAENAALRLAVVGDDGSPAADTVWSWFTAHPWTGWAVEVVTADEEEIVWGRPVEGQVWSPPWERTSAVEGAVVTYLRYFCDARAMLAERSDADLMVVGRHRRDDSFSFLGSTSEWLLVNPPAPLVIVGTAHPIDRVLVAADGSEHSRIAMETFVSLPGAAGATVTVLAVNDERTDPEAAEQLAAELEGRVGRVTTLVRRGRPTQEILKAIEELGIDFTVLGTKGLTGWKRIRLGSTASAVGRAAESNVLVASVATG